MTILKANTVLEYHFQCKCYRFVKLYDFMQKNLMKKRRVNSQPRHNEDKEVTIKGDLKGKLLSLHMNNNCE